MLTNEMVLEIFKDYLERDQAMEVVQTRHGMAAMLWDNAGEDWSEVVCCPTPEKLFDELLDFCTAYQEYLILQGSDQDDLTAENREHVQMMVQGYQEKRKEAETE